MDLTPDVEAAAFRQKVRAFIETHLSSEMAERMRRTQHPSREDVTEWMSILHRKGWSAVGWPQKYGGPGWDGLQRIIFEEECMNADAPPQHFANIHSVGPVIYTFGDDVQRARFLDPLLSGATIWCQGFSEPNAGSDLAALKTKAIRDGDDFIVNGQKIWTSDAHVADWMFALVRTDADVAPHKGISFLLIDMKSPGLTVRPINLIDGSHVVCEVFFDNVRVPATQLVGNIGQGWSIAKFLLANERAFSAEVPQTKRDLKRIIHLAKSQPSGHSTLWDDPLFRAKVVNFQVELEALEFLMLRTLAQGGHEATHLSSLLKIPGSELRQRAGELMVEAVSPYGIVRYPSVYAQIDSKMLPGPVEGQGIAETFAYRRATTIYGGTNEIQRNIIAKLVLS